MKEFVPKGLINNAPTRQQTIIWTNDSVMYLRIYTSLGVDELMCLSIRNDQPHGYTQN